jgi:hypothetical protein
MQIKKLLSCEYYLHLVFFGKNYKILSEFHLKVKVKLSLCLTKHHAMKTYWGEDV